MADNRRKSKESSCPKVFVFWSLWPSAARYATCMRLGRELLSRRASLFAISLEAAAFACCNSASCWRWCRRAYLEMTGFESPHRRLITCGPTFCYRHSADSRKLFAGHHVENTIPPNPALKGDDTGPLARMVAVVDHSNLRCAF